MNLIKYSLLKESLSSARKLYLDTEKINKDSFDTLTKIDPTPTKKYLDWICKTFLEGKYAVSQIKGLIEKFNKAIKTKYELPSKDIYQYKTYDDLLNVLAGFDTYLLNRRASQKNSGAEKIFENDKCVIYYIKTKEACMLYGSNTKWCITQKTHNYWEDYNKKYFFCFLISKYNDRKLAFAIAMDIFKSPSYTMTVWDNEDNQQTGETEVRELAKYDISLETIRTIVLKKIDPNVIRKNRLKMLLPTGSTFNEDGSINLAGDFAIPNTTQFINPDTHKLNFKFNKCEGDFICNYTSLSSLEGCPNEVTGNFDCVGNNHLTSLKGAPTTVGGGFRCSKCENLLSLEGCPTTVGGYFSCNNCSLTSLRHSPTTIHGDFKCFGNKLTSLEGGPTTVSGSYDMQGNPLTSLQGSPETINGHFNCEALVHLKSLEGGPKKVTGDFNCSSCQSLKNLIGAPSSVHGSFYCFSCLSLESLEGGPKTVGDNYFCSNCPELTSLEGAPRKVGNDFSCEQDTKLTSLQGGPTTVGGTFRFHGCPLHDLIGYPIPRNNKLYLLNMDNLESLEGCPETLDEFVCDKCYKLESLAGGPRRVTKLFNVTNTKITTLEDAPECTSDTIFQCNNNALLTSLEGGPRRVKSFICHSCPLTSLRGMPEQIEDDLICSYTAISSLEGCPDTVQRFSCTECLNLESLIGGPTNVKGTYACNKCNLTSLEGCPEEVYSFSCSDNPITSLVGGPRNVKLNYNALGCNLTNLEGVAEIIGGSLRLQFNYNLETLDGINVNNPPNLIKLKSTELATNSELLESYRQNGYNITVT